MVKVKLFIISYNFR